MTHRQKGQSRFVLLGEKFLQNCQQSRSQEYQVWKVRYVKWNIFSCAKTIDKSMVGLKCTTFYSVMKFTKFKTRLSSSLTRGFCSVATLHAPIHTVFPDSGTLAFSLTQPFIHPQPHSHPKKSL